MIERQLNRHAGVESARERILGFSLLVSHPAYQPYSLMTYKDLEVWQRADELALEIYKLTMTFPKSEMYGLTSQLRRAALSVPTNIVEGYARKGDKELARFVNIAIGSLAETEYLLGFSARLQYISAQEYSRMEQLRSMVGKLLWSFYRKISG